MYDLYDYDLVKMSPREAMAILDKYDFGKFIDMCLYFDYTDVSRVMDGMRHWFKELEIYHALDNLSRDEFMDYVSVKYNVVFDEYVRYKMGRTVYPTKKRMRSDLFDFKEETEEESYEGYEKE